MEVYLRLILGCSDMVTRMKTAKFDGFGKLTNQIVTAQAAAEKLRVRDGTVHTPELDKALAKIISVPIPPFFSQSPLMLILPEWVASARSALPL